MASLIEDLARRLGTSPDEARRHLQKLLAGLRAYARREGQAALPGLGTFRHDDGTWSFEPSEALARSVNRSFDDLNPVEVSAPPEGAGHEPSPASPEEPSPAQRKRGASIFDRQDEEDPEEESGEPARGLFAPDAPAEKTPPPAQPTAQEPASSSEEGAPPPPSEEQSAPPEMDHPEEPSAVPPAQQGEENDPWALAASTSPEASATPLPSWTYAALPAGYLVQQRPPLQASDLRDAQLESQPTPASSPPKTAERPPERTTDSLEERTADDRADADRTDKAPLETAPERAPAHRQESRSGSGRRWLAALLLLLVVGVGAWYVLGQQGMVTGPVAVFQRAEAPGEAAPASPSPDNTPAENAPAEGAASNPSPGEGTNASASGEGASGTAQRSPGERAFANAARLNRAQGGWTAVVASVTSRAEAEQVAQRFARRFQDRDYPIDILETTVDGTQRYRVVVGQFSSADQVIQTLEQSAGRFPDDAWGLEIGSE